MQQTPNLTKLTQKYMIQVTYDKKLLKFNLPETSVQSLITFLRKSSKVSQTESVYLYLQPGNKLINRMSKVSQLAKESYQANTKKLTGKQAKSQDGIALTELGSVGSANVIRLKMMVYETF